MPTSTIMRISSSVTCSGWSSALMPNRRRTRLVLAERTATKGLEMVNTKRMIGATIREIFSGWCIAMRLGTSSPRTRLKYASSRVMEIRAMV